MIEGVVNQEQESRELTTSQPLKPERDKKEERQGERRRPTVDTVLPAFLGRIRIDVSSADMNVKLRKVTEEH